MAKRYTLRGRDSGATGIAYFSWQADNVTDPYTGGGNLGAITDIVVVRDRGESGDWKTVLDLDFSAETNQTLLADLAYTIGGKTWTKFNSANDGTGTPMALVNGQGLVIQPKSTSDYNGATRSFPGIQIPLSSLDSTIGLGARVRAIMYVSAQNITANYDSAIFGVDSGSAVAGYLAKYGRGVTAIGVIPFIQAASANLGFLDRAVTLGATSNVLMIDIPRLGHPAISVYYAPAAGVSPFIPADNAFQFLNTRDYSNNTVDMTGFTPTNMSLVLGAQRANSGTALSITIARVRLLWKP